MAKGVAEIALLILLLHADAIDDAVFSLMLLIMFGYILLTPMGMIYALRKLRPTSGVRSKQSVPPSFVRFALDGVRVRDVLDTSEGTPSNH